MKKGKGKNTSSSNTTTNGSSKLLPNSWRIVSSCLKTVSTNASTVVRSAGAAVAASISSSTHHRKDQVTWAGFDKLEFSPAAVKHVLLLGYLNGFQVIDVEDASNFSQLVSKRDYPVTFLQMLPAPPRNDVKEEINSLHPLLLVVPGEEDRARPDQNHTTDSQSGSSIRPSKAVRFYSLRSNCYVKVLAFPSAVFMLRSSPQIIAVGLESQQVCCFDALTLEKKFNLSTYPFPQFEGQGPVRINIGYGPVALGPRWLAYSPDKPYVSNSGRLSPKNLTTSVLSPSTSPGNGNMMARYAMESGKQVAAGIMNLGDMGYKKLSKYCPDLLPEPGWKVGKLTGSELERAGMVVIRDVVSTAVVSQFRAHASPISALCFDPSGTLLVTASVHGNNINIFRIIPSCTNTGSDNYDWNSSHVHLYRLYRGVTTAIIQDICFGRNSQWIAIVSTKGTCHIFVLSPFGGDTYFETRHSPGEDTLLYLVPSPPWWFTSSFTINQQHLLPPPLSTLSVVTRIKNNGFGLLNTVSMATSSATGLTMPPSGAIAATFHTSVSYGSQGIQLMTNFLEHLLVYTPSGFVVQHKLLPSTGIGLTDGSPKSEPGYVHHQDEEFRVRVEPVQWWDVCRRSDCPERGECHFGTSSYGPEVSEIVDNLGKIFLAKEFPGSNKLVKNYTSKAVERSSWYLSNAEVQLDFGRSPIWQNIKICFYIMSPPRVQGCLDGELEIEQISIHKVEIKEKDLLPVFDHFHSMKSGWIERGISLGYDSSASCLENHQGGDGVNEATVICLSNPASLSSTESSEGGSSRRVENLLDADQLKSEKALIPTRQTLNDFCEEDRGSINYEAYILKQKPISPASLSSANTADYFVESSTMAEFLSASTKVTSCSRITGGGSPPPMTGLSRTVPALNTKVLHTVLEAPMLSDAVKSVDIGQVFEESYCNVTKYHGSPSSYRFTEITDELHTGGLPRKKEEPQDDGVLGDFSKEG